MKILVAYMSRSGNTRKVAEAIAGEIDAEKEVKQLGEVDSLEGYDLSFIGFPIEKFGPAQEAVQFLAQKAEGKKVALFATHAAHEDQPHVQGWMAKSRQAAGGAEILGVFNCQGDLAQSAKEAMLKHPDPRLRAWAESAQADGNPNQVRLDRARDFARVILAKV